MNQLCHDSIPNLFGVFDTTLGPPLLYYSYIPIVLVSILLGLYIFFKDRRSLLGRSFFLVTVFFSLWQMVDLVEWSASYNAHVMFAWQVAVIFETGLYLSMLYFSYVFLFGRDVPYAGKVALSFLMLVVLILVPTEFNISAYDIQNCEGILGTLWDIIYAIQPIFIFIMAFMGYSVYRKEKDPGFRRQAVLFTLGSVFFLTVFYLSNVYGEWTKFYEFNLLGPLGMLIFLLIFAYMIVRFRLFNLKVFATQALMIATTVLIGSQLFAPQSGVDFAVTGTTFVVFGISAVYIVRSVRREIQDKEREITQRQEIEKLADELAIANARLQDLDRQKSEFVSIASHQLRSPLTAIKGYSSLVLEGSYGKVPAKIREAVERVFQSSQSLVIVIENFLNISRIEQGRMNYDMAPVDLAVLVQQVVGQLSPNAEKKGLALSFVAKDYDGMVPDYTVQADTEKLRQVILNIIDNSIKYTPKGSVSVVLEKGPAKKIRIVVSDTGIGMSKETIMKLFQKFSRAEGAGKINAGGAGLGLFLAGEIMRAHKGQVLAESDGPDKGSRFIIEFSV